MHSTEQNSKEILSKKSTRGFSHLFIVLFSFVTVLFLGFCLATWSYAQSFQDRIAPNIYFDSVYLGGKTQDELKSFFQQKIDDVLTNGVMVELNQQSKNLPLSTWIGSDFIEYIEFDLETALRETASLFHDENPFLNTYNILLAHVQPTNISIPFTIHTQELNTALHLLFKEDEQMETDTQFQIAFEKNDWVIHVLSGTPGNEIDVVQFNQDLSRALQTLSQKKIVLSTIPKNPAVSKDEAEKRIPIARAILQAAPYKLVYRKEDDTEQIWNLDAKNLSLMLFPAPDGLVQIKQDAFHLFLDPIVKTINVPAQNARFEIQNGKAVQFASSHDGLSVDRDTLYKDVQKQLTLGSTESIFIPTIVEKSLVKTSDVNSIGINEVLGVGISSYKNSPKNRKLNIQNGVNLLNGLLIAPGETFSLLAALKPFSTENGYLKELVIKGDKIEPDIGGGLCQIGTTTFRAVMHSGLPVLERQNHSLVVSYYNDPTNNNPGTDATIFDPAPDFKFTNNTNHYILFQAENIKEQSQLKFTLWGTSDGRKGSYTPPVVTKWIPVGEDIQQVSSDLAPGEKKCQEAHIGANTSFTYTVLNADETKTEKIFSSHYRPLPKICLVGETKIPESTTENITTTPLP